MPPGIDPVTIVAGVLRGRLPTLPMRDCMGIGFEIVAALQEANTVANFQTASPLVAVPPVTMGN